MSERRYGILIASSRFPKEPKLEDLRCPENDVDGVKEILTSKDRGDFSKTFVLKNKPHHTVLVKINQILREASKNDLVLIYYSGHGKLNRAGRLHLATNNTVVSALEATSIPVDLIRSYVDISASNRVVLILDCCFSGAAGAAFARGSVDDQLQLTCGGRGTYILTAATGIQVAQEKESDQYGVFTKHLIDGIRGGEADLDSDGEVTMGELYRYVHDRVLEEGFQEPMKWDLSVRGELVIARSGKTPREERRRQMREMLFGLAAKGILPDDIVNEAIKLIALEPTELSGELRTYDDLLEQLLQKRIIAGDFIREWYKVGLQPVSPEPPLPRPKPAQSHDEQERLAQYDSYVEERRSQVRPWIRYWARYIDYIIASIVMGGLFALIAPSQYLSIGMVIIFLWCFVEAYLLSHWGTTPGKWLLKVKVRDREGKIPTFGAALRRSFSVWWRGVGMGFPPATLVTLLIAHSKLIKQGATTWDRDYGFVISHAQIGIIRTIVASFVAASIAGTIVIVLFGSP